MKRILLLLLIAVYCRLGAQPFLTNLNNFRTFNAGYGALTGTSVIHPPMVFGNVDSVCDYVAQLYALIGAAGNLQAVTAAGNSTTFQIYSGNGTIASPNSGTEIGYGSIAIWNSGLDIGNLGADNEGGGYTTTFFSKDPTSNNFSYLFSGPVTATRKCMLPDEGSGLAGGIGSTIVLHKTQYPDTIGNPAILGAVTNGLEYQLWFDGIPFLSMQNDGFGNAQMTWVSTTHGGALTENADTGSSTFVQYKAAESGTQALINDTLGGSGNKLLTKYSGLTPAGVYTLTNKRITARDSGATNYSGGAVTYNTDSYDGASVSALANSLNFVNPAGTPTNKQFFNIAIKDNGTAQALSWGTNFAGGSTNALPLTTVVSKVLILDCEYLTIDNKWHLVGVDQE